MGGQVTDNETGKSASGKQLEGKQHLQDGGDRREKKESADVNDL